MRARDRALWALAAILSIALLVGPALWNGFPLLQYDTGGYLARWYEGTLVPSRAVVYGLMLNAGEIAAFWPVVLVQAVLTVWVVALMLRAHGLGKRPWLMVCVIAVLTAIATLPWLTSILLTDIFAGLGVLALYLLLLRPGHFSRGERFALIALIAVSAATHSATIAVLLALILAASHGLACPAPATAARAYWQWGACARARLRTGLCRGFCGCETIGLDTWRFRFVIWTHAARRHRQ